MDAHNITIFEPVQELSPVDDLKHKYNVCFYCRISTNKDSQKGSLDNQKSFMEYELKQHPNWIIDMEKDVYFDEGLSGTTEKKRDAFNKMVKLAKEGKYDLIVTKEVSRVFRNSRKFLELIDDLKKQNIFIWFLGENLCTQRDRDYEFILNSASRSEIESHYISKRVKIGQNASYRRGVVFGPNRMLGYKIVREGYNQKFVVVEEEAELVKQIFEMYASGHGTFQIAKAMEKLDKEREERKEKERLEKEQKAKLSGDVDKEETEIPEEKLCIPKWSCTSVLRILKNEKYVGDLLLGKTYTPNVLDHKKVMNTDRKSFKILHTNHHPEQAIISREIWDSVQAELERNAISEERRRKHSNRFFCSGKIVCGVCGESYVSKSKKQKAILENGEPYISKRWVCYRNQNYGSKAPDGCVNTSVNDRVIRDCMKSIVNIIFVRQKDIIASIQKGIEKANKVPVEELEKEIDALAVSKLEQDAVLNKVYRDEVKGIYTESEADQLKADIVEEKRNLDIKIKELEREIKRLKNGESEGKKKLKEIKKFFNNGIDKVDEKLYRNLLDKIVVYPGNVLEIHFTFTKEIEIFYYETKGKMDEYKIDIWKQDYNPYLEGKPPQKD